MKKNVILLFILFILVAVGCYEKENSTQGSQYYEPFIFTEFHISIAIGSDKQLGLTVSEDYKGNVIWASYDKNGNI